MSKNFLFLFNLLFFLFLISCSTLDLRTVDQLTYEERRNNILKYFEEYPTTSFSSLESKLFFNSYNDGDYTEFYDYRYLKFSIFHLIDDSFVYYTEYYNSSKEDVEFSGLMIEKFDSFFFGYDDLFEICTGSPVRANTIDFVPVVSQIYKENFNKNCYIDKISFCDFSYKKNYSFNTSLPEEKLFELRNISVFDITNYLEKQKDRSSRPDSDGPYDFVFICHWISNEFNFDTFENNSKYTNIIYHCVSSVETFSRCTISNILSTYTTNCWVEAFEVYNNETNEWEYYDADEYLNFLKINNLKTPVKFENFFKQMPFCVARWFKLLDDYHYKDRSHKYVNNNIEKYPLKKIKYFISDYENSNIAGINKKIQMLIFNIKLKLMTWAF